MNENDLKYESEFECLSALNRALNALKSVKPNDKSDKDRAYAITITEMEKTIAYFLTFVVEEDAYYWLSRVER